MVNCVSIPLDGGSVLFGGPNAASHAEHEHRETQVTVHLPAGALGACEPRAWIVPGGSPHAGGWNDGTLSIVFHFAPDLLVEAADGGKVTIARGETRDPLICCLGAATASEFRAPDRLFLNSVHQVLAGRLIRCHGREAHPASGAEDRLAAAQIRKLRDFLETEMNDTISVATMARTLGMGPQKLTRLLRSTTGFSPHQFVTRFRVQRAKELLKHRRIGLAEIAFQLGFSSQSHFTAVFRRHAGVTPKAYRQAVLTSPR